jgi:hypothetical protein
MSSVEDALVVGAAAEDARAGDEDTGEPEAGMSEQ